MDCEDCGALLRWDDSCPTCHPDPPPEPVVPVAIQRLMDEVRLETAQPPSAYDRAHQRHNR